jgi:uncharacterized protein YbjT (DUF2867 family)
MENKTIIVCGATGKQGTAVAQNLLARKSWNVVALSRNPEGEKAQALAKLGIEVRKADLYDEISLIKAFEHAYGVFGITQPWSPDYKSCNPDSEVKQGYNIVNACIKTGIKHLVLSTAAGISTEKTGIPHVDSKLQIEAYARTGGVPCTLLKPAQFMDNIGAPFFPINKGTVRGFIDRDVKVIYIATHDIGVFAAITFENREEYIWKELNLIGDFVSGEEICQILSRIRNGESFKYKSVSRLLMRVFSKEFYLMRTAFEKFGRPPYPEILFETIEHCKRMHPSIMSVEQYLKIQGYDRKEL